MVRSLALLSVACWSFVAAASLMSRLSVTPFSPTGGSTFPEIYMSFVTDAGTIETNLLSVWFGIGNVDLTLGRAEPYLVMDALAGEVLVSQKGTPEALEWWFVPAQVVDIVVC